MNASEKQFTFQVHSEVPGVEQLTQDKPSLGLNLQAHAQGIFYNVDDRLIVP